MVLAVGAADLQRLRSPPVYQLLSGAMPLPGMHQNKVWRGLAQTPGNTEPGVSLCIKWLQKKEVLATELACALAGEALKLQVPRGALVLAQKDQLPGLPSRAASSDSRWENILCFGSELQWPDDTIARPIGRMAVEEWVWQRLCSRAEGPAGAVWDELVANEDRHHENVVFDGNRWWFIDHEFTLAPVAQAMKKFADAVSESSVRQRIVEHRSSANMLAYQVMTRRRESNGMKEVAPTLTSLKQRLAWVVRQAQDWRVGLPEVDTVLLMTAQYLASIELRLPALPLHLDRRLQSDTKPLTWTSSNASTPPTRPTKRPPA